MIWVLPQPFLEKAVNIELNNKMSIDANLNALDASLLWVFFVL